MITILITGVGGPLGQALIKAARQSAISCRLIGTDRTALSVGLGWVDQARVIATAAEPDAYLRDIREICQAEQVNLILPGSESELELLSSSAGALHERTGASVVASPPEVLRVGLDKLETCRFLESARLRFPSVAPLRDVHAVAQLIERFGFPLIAKPRRGSGSRGLCKVRCREDIDYLRTLTGELVLQEYLQPDHEEYTVAVYTLRDGRQAGSICFKRELAAGNTYRAWVNQDPVVLAEADAVVRALRPSGPCNVQLRLTARGAVTFEINPRFSGTTGIRAHFGFNEVEMAIRDFALAQSVPVPVVRPGIALRFWDEVYLGADGEREMSVLSEPAVAKPPAAPVRIALPGGMRVLRVDQAEEWTCVLHKTTQHDFYFLPGYHALAEQLGEGDARLFVYEQEDYVVALPLMLRSIPGERGLRDATSVYGYAGPLASHEHLPPPVVRNFQASLAEALRDRRVISVFSRLHPLISQSTVLEGCGKCQVGGQTISIDLTLPPEAQRAQYRGTVRTRINQLQRGGITCVRDAEKARLNEFMSIYDETMRRVGATDAYLFDRQYFTRLVEGLGSVLQLFLVTLPSGEAIAGGLFTLCDRVIQYHLGGTRDAYLKLSPMRLLMEEVRLWGNEQGARVLHLGGGVGSKPDSLFQFKAGFSDRRHDFLTWRWVIAQDVYDTLMEEQRRGNERNGTEEFPSEFFPAYRDPARQGMARAEPASRESEVVSTHG